MCSDRDICSDTSLCEEADSDPLLDSLARRWSIGSNEEELYNSLEERSVRNGVLLLNRILPNLGGTLKISWSAARYLAPSRQAQWLLNHKYTPTAWK